LKLNIRTTDIPESLRWRDVYITDNEGTLISAIRVFTQQEANLRSIPYHFNWRRAFTERAIKSGDNILCDDNYVVPVKAVEYGTTSPSITLETGRWVVPRLFRHTAHKDPQEQLHSTIITSNPHGFKRYCRYNIGVRQPILQLRRLALEFLNNGFDKYKAYGDTFKVTHPRKKTVDSLFNSPETRFVIMSESIHWFERSGITPDVVLKRWFEMVFADETSPDSLNEALLLYAKLHPDMEVKGLDVPRTLPPQANLFLGSQQNFDRLQGASTEEPDKPVQTRYVTLDTIPVPEEAELCKSAEV
jgi:hypothetical protein